VSSTVATVVKVGGAIIPYPGALDLAMRALESAAARGDSLLVVPGGGPFADAVRRVDRALSIESHAAHWMAILAMDQHAHLLVSRGPSATLIEHPDEAADVLRRRELPVLAPYRWLRAADPLPHSWDVTSDSIAAWVAGQVHASRLLLVKPVTGEAAALVDAYFERVLPAGIRVEIADAAGLTEALRSA
jgi:aspartokinase-like uncharacterized kinase